MPKAKSVFVCNGCGYESSKWLGKCPACNEWNTFFEQKLDTKTIEYKKQNKQTSEPVSLKDVTSKEIKRMSTGFLELDRVLGGGLVDGSLILLGGEPRNTENQHSYYKYVIKYRQKNQSYIYQEKNQKSK